MRRLGLVPERGEAQAPQGVRLQSLHSCSPRLSVEGGHGRVRDVVGVRLFTRAHAGHQRRGECPLHLRYQIITIITIIN